MTRKEAIEELKRDIHNAKVTHHLSKHYEMAIKALEQEPCEDCISRKAVHDMLENLPVTVENKWFNWLQKACLRLAELPSVQPKSKTGHWEERALVSDEIRVGDKYFLVCSNCNLGVPKGLLGFANYCPNCGAKMESEEV